MHYIKSDSNENKHTCIFLSILQFDNLGKDINNYEYMKKKMRSWFSLVPNDKPVLKFLLLKQHEHTTCDAYIFPLSSQCYCRNMIYAPNLNKKADLKIPLLPNLPYTFIEVNKQML